MDPFQIAQVFNSATEPPCSRGGCRLLSSGGLRPLSPWPSLALQPLCPGRPQAGRQVDAGAEPGAALCLPAAAPRWSCRRWPVSWGLPAPGSSGEMAGEALDRFPPSLHPSHPLSPVSWGSCDQVPLPGRLASRSFFAPTLEAGRPKSRVSRFGSFCGTVRARPLPSCWGLLGAVGGRWGELGQLVAAGSFWHPLTGRSITPICTSSSHGLPRVYLSLCPTSPLTQGQQIGWGSP